MKTTMTVLEEAADLETRLAKGFVRYERKRDALLARTHAAVEESERRLTEKHNAQMDKLTSDWYAEEKATRGQYSDEAVGLLDRLAKKAAE